MVQKNAASNLPSNLVAGLDIGTTKVCMVAALVQGKELEIIGTGIAPSTGLKKGVIVNRAATVQAIGQALDECQKKCGYTIESVCVGIAGEHVEGVDSHGIVSIKNDVIDHDDIMRVIDSAKPAGFESKIPIHILSKDYTVDYQSGFDNPLGIVGKRLEADVHVILASSTALANITRSCMDAGLKVERVVLEPYASALSVLNEDEKELGVLLLDIGGGTTDIVAYKDKSIQVSGIIPIGGSNVTHDISVGLTAPYGRAEKIKCQEGSVCILASEQNQPINLNPIEGHPTRPVIRQAMVKIIEPRYIEIFDEVRKMLEKPSSSFEKTRFSLEKTGSSLEKTGPSFDSIYSSGVVLTGGASQIKNLALLAKDFFKLHTRIGYPDSHVRGANDFVKDPAYATAVGLLKYVIQNENADHTVEQSLNINRKTKGENGFLKFIKQFF